MGPIRFRTLALVQSRSLGVLVALSTAPRLL
jgi:hypothetical protein